MITDLTTSKDLIERLRTDKKSDQLGPGVTFTAEVLTTVNWPGEQFKCIVPQELKACETEFEAFYTAINKRKELKWLYHYGSTELHTTYVDKKY